MKQAVPNTLRALLGQLAFLSTTRPDLQFGISLFGSFTVEATEYKYSMLYRMAQFAKQTAKRGIRYRVRPCREFILEAWSDASFESDVRDAQSGYIIALNGSPIFRRSCKQRGHIIRPSRQKQKHFMTVSIELYFSSIFFPSFV